MVFLTMPRMLLTSNVPAVSPFGVDSVIPNSSVIQGHSDHSELNRISYHCKNVSQSINY